MVTTNQLRLHGVFVLLFLLASCARSPEGKLIGEWKGTDNTGKTASIVLNENSQARFIIGTVVLEGSWKLDASRNPIELDLTVQRPSNETATIPMILRFLTENKIQLRMSNDEMSRPVDFSGKDERNQIVLERQ